MSEIPRKLEPSRAEFQVMILSHVMKISHAEPCQAESLSFFLFLSSVHMGGIQFQEFV